jgi:hypothetical protein
MSGLLLVAQWAIWPTALVTVLGFAAFATITAPAEWFRRERH